MLVAWEHVNIQYLTEDLGVSKDKIPSWSDSDFDTVYELTFEAGLMTGFRVSAQNFSVPPATAAQVETKDAAT